MPPELLTPESMDCRHSDHHNATTQPCLALLQACPCCHFLREHRLRLRRGSCQQFTRLSWFLQCKMEQMGASLRIGVSGSSIKATDFLDCFLLQAYLALMPPRTSVGRGRAS